MKMKKRMKKKIRRGGGGEGRGGRMMKEEEGVKMLFLCILLSYCIHSIVSYHG
jgi:hypothetical protein